ncbi:hypothetical protein PF004_g28942 [Phytophthora fragariae]|uniref:Uncharacterized protein n=1 Tax=Phytophthora fragariae TaxID=53985 RepID=A0A6G0MH63_9STRA|nr:hypothetical protein PF003_g27946 [Phytophthora fragariae]KAE9167089.1 hypothetical protein PF004_g28942 [Phytophthora fragariae]
MWPTTLLLVLLVCVCAAQSTSESSSGSSSDVYSSSGSTGDIYNVCPVVVDFSEEQEDLSNEELKANAADAAMSAYLLSHPNNTLWDYFKIERKQKREMFKKLPLKEKIKKCSRASQIGSFFKEFGKNIKSLWGLMKEDPKETAENMGGGLLLHITHHPSEFTAETVLMVSGGFAVIHGLMAGVEAVFGTMSNVISKVLLSVLMFIHAIDDPIYIVTPLVTSIVNTAGELANGGNSSADSTVLTVDPIQPSETCQIPKQYRPVFSSRDLCLSTPAEVRQLIFGTVKRTAKMTQAERIAAYNRFHDFVCCYLEDQEFEVNAPKMDSTAFEADLVSTSVKMSNCSELLGDYSAATLWESSTGYDDSASLDYESASGDK